MLVIVLFLIAIGFALGNLFQIWIRDGFGKS
jgi:hypothetical protein